MKKLFVFTIFLLGGHNIWAQEGQIKLKKHETDLLNILLTDTVNSTNFTLPNSFNFGTDNLLFTNSNVIKRGKEIYIQLLGTGRLYQVNKINNQVQVARIDRTTYSGVNFFAQNFFIKDTLFQFGGLGFWQYRGILTYYSKLTKQWELVQSNRIVQCFFDDQRDAVLHYDDHGSSPKMYVSNSYYYPNYPSSLEVTATDSCYAYDFNSRTWNTLGKLTPDAKKIFDSKRSHEIELHHNDIMFFQSMLEFYWISFEKNQLGKLTPKENNKLRQIWLSTYNDDKTKTQTIFQFSLGNDLYYLKLEQGKDLEWKKTTINFNEIDTTNTIEIYSNKKSFFETTINVYREHKVTFFLLLSILILIIGIRSGILQKKRIPKEVTSILYQNFFTSLNIVEKELIEALYQSNLKGEDVSTKTINKIIGVQQKDTLTQNKSRSDHFIKINQKFKMATQNAEPLIVKNRDKDDKRQYNYGLSKEYLNAIEKLFKSQTK